MITKKRFLLHHYNLDEDLHHRYQLNTMNTMFHHHQSKRQLHLDLKRKMFVIERSLFLLFYQSTWWKSEVNNDEVAEMNVRQSILIRDLSNVSFVNIETHFHDVELLKEKNSFENSNQWNKNEPGNQCPTKRLKSVSKKTRLNSWICSADNSTCALINRNK